MRLSTQKPKSSAYPKEFKTLGDHIRKRRLDLRLFQEQVSEQIGVDEDTIFRWEGNKSKPQVQFIPAIIKFLGYNPLPIAVLTSPQQIRSMSSPIRRRASASASFMTFATSTFPLTQFIRVTLPR